MSTPSYDPIGALIAAAIIVAVVFLLCREILCWYWKINRVVGILEKIEDQLRRLKNSSGIQTEKQDGSVINKPSSVTPAPKERA